MKCIYCLEEKERQYFTQEHVLSQAFGKFEQNLTLNEDVCGDCNNFFGKTFETILSRDTFEGSTLRYERNIKADYTFKSQGKRSQLIYKIEEDGEYKGAYFYPEYSEETNRREHYICPQIGFVRKSGEYEWYLLDNIPERASIDLSQYNYFKNIGCDLEEVIESLHQKGFDIKQIKSINGADDFPSEFTGEVTRYIDDDIFRPIAKISFNYLTKWKGKDFVMDIIFDPIRKYIRYGEKPIFPFKFALPESFFPDEKERNPKRNGHVIAIYWEKTEESLVACVSLFNFILYFVRLTPDQIGRYKDLKKGAFFNLHQRNILEIDMSKINLDFSEFLNFGRA